MMSRSAEMTTEYGTVNQPQGFQTKREEARKQSFECIWERTIQDTQHSLSPNRMYRMPARGSPKGFPCPYFTTKGREFTYQSSFFIKKSNLRKERGKNYEFLYNSGNRIKDSRNSNRRRRGSMGRDQPA